jgi:membrane protein implicated in regulation of membrane protease activity
MRTKQMIVGIVLAIVLVALTVLVGLMVWLGPWLGLGIAVALAAAIFLLYVLVIAPWQHRWGATDDELARTLPGDEIAVPHVGSATRAITIAAPPDQVWPGWCRSV